MESIKDNTSKKPDSLNNVPTEGCQAKQSLEHFRWYGAMDFQIIIQFVKPIFDLPAALMACGETGLVVAKEGAKIALIVPIDPAKAFQGLPHVRQFIGMEHPHCVILMTPVLDEWRCNVLYLTQ